MITIGLSFVGVSLIGGLDFSVDFELITDVPYAEKTSLFVLVLSALIGTYVSVFQIWRNTKEKSHYYFGIVYSVLLLIASFLVISWLTQTSQAINEAYNSINFPNEVDQLTVAIKRSFITSSIAIFKLLLGVGTITLGFMIFALKSVFKG